jgi:hypothetical protein
VPKRGNLSKTANKAYAVKELITKKMPQEKIAEKLSISGDTIQKWKNEIIPGGSGLPARYNYESMSLDQLERDWERKQAVAKMYLIERIIDLSPHEKDMGKISGALRDISNMVGKMKENGEEKADSWGEFVEKAIKEVSKKKPVINVIQNQQINNHGTSED